MTYLISVTIVLIVLNLYFSTSIPQLFYNSKEASLTDKSQVAAIKVGSLDQLTPSAVSDAISQLHTLKATHLVVTDYAGRVIYETGTAHDAKENTLPSEIGDALSGKAIFICKYTNGAIYSKAATPIISYGSIIGCVYMMEYDTEQGALIKSLKTTFIAISVILEVVFILFAWISSRVFSKRFRKIMNSMRVIQEGNYSSQVTLKGNDELSYLAKEFNHLTRLLQISENKRRQFVSDASHELKTPLASIKLLSDSILQNDIDIKTAKEFVFDIGEEAERLNRMTQKLLDLTRSGEETEKDDREIMHMAPTIERVVHMLSPLAQSTGVTLITQLEPDTTIRIREDDLYRIIYNLLDNGIKYNVPNGTLIISLTRENEFGILIVSDTGTGIPEEALGKIYERFYRVDKARSRATGGSGLGLAIVKNMVERNEGKISVESTLGVGTVFTVQFPAFEMKTDPMNMHDHEVNL